ncbi:type IIL restriction-modification enzyme MmeI, partial [uncultured Flavobacterium sp.]|uniref:type IIL restriction-modification enzyme MmeI n=1 Tax=uncultured Flavobacterium sp. TaxID=165435 RepID=UPI0027E0D9D9
LHVLSVLEEREKFPERTLAQLYDPNKMPKSLKEVHHELDLAIERCYRLKPFESDNERLEYLFKLYEEMTNRNIVAIKQKKIKK